MSFEGIEGLEIYITGERDISDPRVRQELEDIREGEHYPELTSTKTTAETGQQLEQRPADEA